VDDLEAKVWAVNVGGKQMQVRDLPIRVLDEIGRDTETNWHVFLLIPYADLRVAERIIMACADKLGVDKPDPDSLTGRTVIEFFVEVAEDLPEVLENGVPQ